MRGAHSDVWCSKVHPLDRSGAFRSGTLPPCTGWPRTVMRGALRKGNSGHNSAPKANRRTEPSSRNPRFAAHLRCVSAKEGKGSQEGTGNHVWCPVPFCLRRQTAAFPPVNTGSPGRRRRPMSTPSEGVKSPPAAHRCIGGKVCRLLQIKQKGHSSPAAASRRIGGTASPPLTVSQAKREPFGSL